MTGGAGLITNIGGGGGSGEVVISTITQDNSFETGNTVYNDNGVWKLAQANDADTLATHLITNVTSTTFDIVSIGKVEWASHGLGTAGQILYTSETISGGLTTTEPGTYSNPVGFIFDENNIFIIPWRASATMGTSMTFNNMCRMHSGVATITGGAGDVTITVPFDWTGGYLTLIQTDTSSEYYLDATTNYAKIETTYEALTNSNYTTDQIMAYISNTTPELYIRDKSLDTNGVPKSATPTSFTLNEAGTTMYVKYFVWAPYSQTITFGSNETMTISGSGAPTSTPVNIGDMYIDTTAKREYKAYGTSTSVDWELTDFGIKIGMTSGATTKTIAANTLTMCRFLTYNTSTISNIGIYFDGAATGKTIKMAIYSDYTDGSRADGEALSVTSEYISTSNTAYNLIQIPLVTPIRVTKGNYYWIAYLANNGMDVIVNYNTARTVVGQYYARTYTDGFPIISSSGTAEVRFVFYAV